MTFDIDVAAVRQRQRGFDAKWPKRAVAAQKWADHLMIFSFAIKILIGTLIFQIKNFISRWLRFAD